MSKLIYGIGYNSKGEYKARVDGKKTNAYATWYGMLRRVYCLKRQAKQPTYICCSVDEAFHDFQDFAEWFENHEYSHHGYELDKDLLVAGNKIYSPDYCVFVPSQLNTLLTDSGATRGQYPQGVDFIKTRGRFRSRLNINGKNKHLGCFDCPHEAHQSYKEAKEAYVKRMAIEWRDDIAGNVFEALMNWKLS